LMSANRCIIQLGVVLTVIWPKTAVACNTCTLADFDYILPPFVFWQFLPVVWFTAACIAANKGNPRPGGFPKTWVGIVIGIGTFIFGNAFGLGPWPALLLFIPPVVLAFNSADRSMRAKWDKEQRHRYIRVSVIGSVALVCLIILTIWIRLSRTPGEFVAQWGPSGRGRLIIEEFQASPNADLNEIRLIVSKSNSLATAELAQTLAQRGDPATDFPILLEALKKSRGRLGSGEYALEEALRMLTGLDLPAKTSIKDWQKAFYQKLDSASPTISTGSLPSTAMGSISRLPR